jgi:hypothetical protein
MERMERAGKPRHRWANPRGRESGRERVNEMSDMAPHGPVKPRGVILLRRINYLSVRIGRDIIASTP